MAHVINDECVSCGSCEGECPVGAISEGDGKYEIDADACVDCGACEAACPTGAIIAEYFIENRKVITRRSAAEQTPKRRCSGLFVPSQTALSVESGNNLTNDY